MRLRFFLLSLVVGSLLLAIPLPAFKPPAHRELPNIDKRRGPLDAQVVPETRRAAKAKLSQEMPEVTVEWDEIRGTPRRIGSTKGFLTGPKGEGKAISKARLNALPKTDRHRVVKAFLNEHTELFGHGAEVLDGARLQRDGITAHNGMRTMVWEQMLDGIPVFEGVLVAHLTRDEELVNLSSQFMPDSAQAAEAGKRDPRAARARTDIAPKAAIRIAAAAIEEDLTENAVVALEPNAQGAPRRQKFKAGTLPGRAEVQLVWLPMSGTEMRLCWQVELVRRTGGELYRVLVDATTGEVMVRHCQTFYLSDVSYRVFTSDSPAPMSPGLSVPATNQPPLVLRNLVTLAALDTNASPVGWIADGENQTRGNNVDAHLDRDADNDPDLPRPQGNPERVFDFPLDLTQGPETYRDAAVVQLFYWCNWMHDRLYELGFNEASGNFQKDNFGRGGRDNDPVLADAQDGSGFNNANFTPTADGESPRVQMYIFDGPDPDTDGDLDAEIILHEYAHGLSTRLVGGGVGIFQIQTIGLSEGWSDFYALALLSEPGDDVDGTYAMGGYSTHNFFGLQENYYFGIRRYPYSTDLSKSPLTLRDIDPGQAIAHEGVPLTPRRKFDPLDAPEVHNQGELWCVTLWEARANLIKKYGFETGNHLILQLVTDGMKLSPPNPTFLQARDAILQADLVDNTGANQRELWAAFAKRGMGVKALVPSSSTTEGVREAYDTPDDLVVLPATPLLFGGPVGGPLSPLCRVLTITNPTELAIQWNVTPPPDWLSVSPMSGTVDPGQSTHVSVCLNGSANDLPAATHTATLVFTNLNTAGTVRRQVQLRLTGLASMPFREDFESGRLKSYWSVGGAGFGSTLISTNFEPHGGTNHLLMHSLLNGYAARNELSLALDLEGYTNVVLRFWARQFNEEPNGPPLAPFIDNANFDGVAVSVDGVSWYEAKGLRTLGESYSDVVVPLDEVLARYGLRYGSTFRIRFNQYDNGVIPDDGIAIDDIEITGQAPRRFVMALPSSAREDDGVLAGAGSVSVSVPVPRDVVVQLLSSDSSTVRVPATVVILAGMTRAPFDISVEDDALLDGSRPVMVSATAEGFVGGRADMTVHDNEGGVLTVSIPASAIEGDGLLVGQGLLRADRMPVADIPVTLTASRPDELQLPSMLIIPAGQTSVLFNITIVDDARIDGTQSVFVRAHVENWTDDVDVIDIMDNEARTFEVSLPALANESAGQLVNAGLVRIPGTLEHDLAVTLSSSDTLRMTVPPVIVIPAGQTGATFSLTVVDDATVDGTRTVTVTVAAAGFGSGSASIRVHDNETPPIPFDPTPRHRSTEVGTPAVLSWRVGRPELIVNGGFETGDFSGWIREDIGQGTFVVSDGTVNPPGPEGPIAPYGGRYSALAQQSSPGRHVLYQDVTIPIQVETAVLDWTDLIHNDAGQFANNHSFRVEIRTPNNDLLAVPFSTMSGDPARSDWTERSHSLSVYKGQTIRVAFVEEDSLGFLNVLVDDVRIMITFPGITASEVYLSTNAVVSVDDLMASTTNTFYFLPALQERQTYYWQVAARRGNERVFGPIWQFTTRGVGTAQQFVWSPIPNAVTFGRPFPVTLTATDASGQTVTNFSGLVHLRGERRLATRPVRVLTFSGFTQLITEYRGTRSAISTYFTNYVETRNSSRDPATLNALLADKDVLLIPEQETAVGTDLADLGASWSVVLSNFVSSGGTVVVCSYTRDEHQILGQSGLLPLEKLGTESSADVITVADHFLTEGVSPAFSGRALATYGPVGDVALRTADGTAAVVLSQKIGAGQVIMIGTDFSVSRTEMDRIVANAVKLPQTAIVQPVAVEPEFSGYLLGGIWSGDVSVLEVGGPITLIAEDAVGHSGVSNPFAVRGVDDLAVTLTGNPAALTVGGTVAYRVTVTNSGPATANGVFLTNRVPAALAVASIETSQGNCTVNASGFVVCNLGTLFSGQAAVVTLVATPTAPGKFNVETEVAGAATEAYRPNNVASLLTSVSLPALSISDSMASEGDIGETEALFAVRLFPPSTQTVSCDYATVEGTASAGSDFLPASGRLIFSPGETNRTFTIRVQGDLLNEGTEVFFVELTNASNAAIIDRAGGAGILDNDLAPVLAVSDVSLREGDAGSVTNAVFRLALSAPSGSRLAVDYVTGGGNAAPVLDYVAGSGTVEFLPGETNKTVTVMVNGDDVPEANETFTLQLSNPVGLTLSRNQAVATIVDDDTGRLDHFVWSMVGTQALYAVPFPATISAVDAANALVTTFNGPVALSGFTATREANVSSGSATWEFPMGTYYHDERLQAIYLATELGSPGRITALSLFVGGVPGQTMQNWTLRLKQTTLASYTAPAWETNGWTVVYQRDEIVAATGWITFLFDHPFEFDGTRNLLVDFSFNNSSFTADGQCRYVPTTEPRSIHLRTDSGFGDPLSWQGSEAPRAPAIKRVPAVKFSLETPVLVSPQSSGEFVAGTWSGLVSMEETGNNLFLRASDHNGHNGTSTPFAVTVINDVGLMATSAPNPASIGSDVTFTTVITNTGPALATGVRVTNALPADITFISASSSGGSCFRAGPDIVCALGDLAANSTGVVEVVVRASDQGDFTNRVTVTKNEPELYLRNNTATVVTTLSPPAATISGGSVVEGNVETTNILFNITLSHATSRPASVDYFAAGAGATNGRDFIGPIGTILFVPGTTNQQLSVIILPDLMDETNETFAIRLRNPTNLVIGLGEALGTIIDDDSPPSITFGDMTVVEGNSGGTVGFFTANLSAPSAQLLWVSYVTSNGTAVAGSDYDAKSGLLLFPPGLAARIIPILVKGDMTKETDETFYLNVSSPVNVVIARDQAIGRILNDDGLIGVVDHFEWGAVASPQRAGMPFPATIAAKDSSNNTISNFAGTVSVQARTGPGDVTVGTATIPWRFPMATGYEDARTQAIYTRAEVGAARRILGLALDVVTPPVQPLFNWTIRMRHTPLSQYSGIPVWESANWVQVFRGTVVIPSNGWNRFMFSTPFDYDGTNNLMVDFVLDSAYFTSDGICRSTSLPQDRTLTVQTDGEFGDPLAWAPNSISPSPKVNNAYPNVQFISGSGIPVTPGFVGSFINGIWTGMLMVNQAGTNLVLRADNSEASFGLSLPINVLAMPDADGDGLDDSWEQTYFGSLHAANGGPYEDPDQDGFSNLQEFQAGTNPLDPSSFLLVTSVQVAGADVGVSFQAVSGKRYRLERTESLAAQFWIPIGGPITGAGTLVTISVSGGGGLGQRFYRVRLLLH